MKGGFQAFYFFPSVHWYFPSPWLQFTTISEIHNLRESWTGFRTSMKNTMCTFFLEILFMIFSKWFVNLEVLKLSFTYLDFLLISKCLFPDVYWKSTFISFRLLTLSKIEFLSSLPQSHLLFLLYSLSWWLVYSSPSVSMGDWLLMPNSWILKSHL